MNVDAQAQQFANDIRYTQALSMSFGQRYYISQASSTTYQIASVTGNTAILMPNGATIVKLGSGLTFGSWGNLSNNLVTFDTRGFPYLDTGSPGTQLVQNTTYSVTITGGGYTKTITISPVSGMVTVT